MSLFVYVDGQFLKKEEARVSVFDRGLLYGDGVFEGIRAYNNRVFKLKEHIDRLYESAKAILLNIPIDKEEMMNVVLETLRRNNLREAYIRLVVTRGEGTDLSLDPRKCPKPTIFCIAAPLSLFPQSFYEEGIEAVTASTRRNFNEATSPRIKSLNYLNNILAKIEANLCNVPEAIILNQDGYVTEGTGENIFIAKKGKLITPPAHVGILEGITRNTVMELARQEGLIVEESLFTRFDLYNADECFLTGTAAEIMPVVKVDGRTINDGEPGPITKMLMKKFKQYVLTDGPFIFE
ncbi:MAG: Branched-chain amino acid aminotransferase [Thermotoga sp. 50_1627]|uniref:branched-chain-amino-acid transaminase n=1 Tax=Pseudothermotoga sp. TaxID=2033661 RepID=UPI00076DB361|nr:MAG: Branched-chain amino acid aminotransferase [Thermotoga sp. 50_64]KUK24447.1 MAG: Branched-chain amino acid aminotransferase [Thermotoga sp. 50_1627]MBC7117119.1 branched-chain-amino-acid transaminase [Pseudothermotoga sp.]MBC7121639.1 branched-chain-amino-acid transaminase [Pseudothermotoga sp.]MDK2922936.1 branched-chain amino acid aminotransferase [Pseudothermotoga sp.]